MQLIHKLRLPAVFCALAVLLCELIARPYTNMGICDDGAYIIMARTLANTGHVAYNGWSAAMMLLQLYFGAAFIKLFGFSYTSVRASTLVASLFLAFLLQRTLVRVGINSRNATLGTLVLVLSPLYLLLSVTFMSDITGLLAIVLCLYGCLRALQAPTSRSSIGWICFAVATNGLCGTSRQIAWLGILVMIPCTLWLLRAQRSVLMAGSAATFTGMLFILACMHWLKHQRYLVWVPLFVHHFPFSEALAQLALLFLDIPFLILPVAAIFLPELRKFRPYILVILSVSFLVFIFFAIFPSHLYHYFNRLLEPAGGRGSWVTRQGIVVLILVRGWAPVVFLNHAIQILLTFVSIGGVFGWFAVLGRRGTCPSVDSSRISWQQLVVLIGPFFAAYCVFLFLAVGTTYSLYDRYALGLLVILIPCLVRIYQERVQSHLPSIFIVLIAIMAAYGFISVHNLFAFDRARVALAEQLTSSGVPDTAVDGGWDQNFDVELRYADHINNPLLGTRVNGYTPVPTPAHGECDFWYEKTPHIHPLYSVSLNPNDCYGPAPFAPVHYSRWPFRTPGTLYVVRYNPTVPSAR